MKFIKKNSLKKAYYVKRQDFSKKCFEKFAFLGLDIEPEPEPAL
jgi:hypothetical protein